MDLIKLMSLGFALLFSLMLALFYGLYLERRARRALETKYQAMALLHKNTRKQHDALLVDVDELRCVSLDIGQKVLALTAEVSQLSAKQQQLDYAGHDNRLYSRANKMAELGADLDELVEECQLPLAEAELLLSIKRKSTIS